MVKNNTVGRAGAGINIGGFAERSASKDQEPCDPPSNVEAQLNRVENRIVCIAASLAGLGGRLKTVLVPEGPQAAAGGTVKAIATASPLVDRLDNSIESLAAIENAIDALIGRLEI